MTRTLRAVYVHGRPAPHPNRIELLPAIGAELVPCDLKLPWAHLERPPSLRKLTSLLVCAMTFPRRTSWDVFIGDGPQYLPLVMKRLRLLRRDQLVLPYLAGEFSYFLATGHYGPRKTRLLTALLRQWDGYLCVGEMVADLTRRVLPAARHADIFTFQNFIREARAREMAEVDARLQDEHVVFVGNGPGGFRVFYKGLDLLLEAIARARSSLPRLACSIVGEWSEETRRALRDHCGGVRWLGQRDDLGPVFRAASLYVHCGRGDAWPNTVMEAMAAGVPALVSEWTGGHEFVSLVEPRLVAPLASSVFAERIAWYFGLATAERRALGARGRDIVTTRLSYSASRGSFRRCVRLALDRFALRHLRLPGEAL
jgi:glycosyltransferase involved in cell wall biosynthesis